MSEDKDDNKLTTGKIIVFSIVSVLIIVILGVILYLQITRYKLIGKTIEKGDYKDTALLLSPEISQGVKNILYN